MRDIKQNIYNYLPYVLQNLMITFYNLRAYSYRLSGNYKLYRTQLQNNKCLSLRELKEIQFSKLVEFLNFAKDNSTYYKEKFCSINLNSFKSLDDIGQLSILTKEDIRMNLVDISTIGKSEGIIAKTGGTTGSSLQVIFTKDDIQHRFAYVDNVRSQFGYALGKKTAWFSGKNILTERDLKRKRFWKTDYFHNVRYYSTYHIKRETIRHYIQNLISYEPQYLIGFPSNMYELSKYGQLYSIEFPKCIKAIFTNAETLNQEMRESITNYFYSKIYDQYGSAEGAPFIFECKNGKYHLELQSGVYEVLNEKNLPAKEGRLIVTSFDTKGTPLVRYDIGDNIKLSDEICSCGNNNPLVDHIQGRSYDYIYSEETGKINSGNLSNCTKNVTGIINFQIVQNDKNKIEVYIIVDRSTYNKNQETLFINNLRIRLGHRINIAINYVNDIERENSGKYRFIKNNIINSLDI